MSPPVVGAIERPLDDYAVRPVRDTRRAELNDRNRGGAAVGSTTRSGCKGSISAVGNSH